MGIAISVVIILIATVVIQQFLSRVQSFIKKWVLFNPVPPGEKPYPPFRHALMLRGDSSDFYKGILKIASSAHDAGREIGCLWLGVEPVILVTGAKAAEVLLRSSEHMEKSFLYDHLHPWLGTGLLTSKGEKWKSRRKLLTPSFHFSILNEFLGSMNEQSVIFTEKLGEHAKSGKSFDIFHYITLCALDIICHTAMGERIEAQINSESDYVKAIYRASDLIQIRQKSPWLWNEYVYEYTPGGRELKKCLKTLHDFTGRVIEKRKKDIKGSGTNENTGKLRRAFLDLLIEVSENGKVLSSEDIREEVDTFMFEGHDTTAAGMAWAVHLIGSHPNVQQKVHEELDEIFQGDGDSEITPDDLRRMNYLERVIKESLRVFPSVPLIGRVTTSNCRVDGQDIPAGTSVAIANQFIMNNSNYWTEPSRFDPDRFETEKCIGRHPYAFIPFSAGPRNCIGQKFATMEEKVVLAHLFRKFRVESCDNTAEIKQMSDLILRPGNGINVKLEVRS